MDEASFVIKLLEKSGAICDGHFLLASGLHSNKYIQCSFLSRFPWVTKEIMEILSRKVENLDFDVVISPAVGALIFGYEIAKLLFKQFIYTERVDGKMQLRRGFKLSSKNKVLIVEDVITTGESSLEVAEIVRNEQATISGFSCVVLRGEVSNKINPLFYLQKLILPTYELSKCPMCKNNMPLQIPGTKQLIIS